MYVFVCVCVLKILRASAKARAAANEFEEKQLSCQSQQKRLQQLWEKKNTCAILTHEKLQQLQLSNEQQQQTLQTLQEEMAVVEAAAVAREHVSCHCVCVCMYAKFNCC